MLGNVWPQASSFGVKWQPLCYGLEIDLSLGIEITCDVTKQLSCVNHTINVTNVHVCLLSDQCYDYAK